MSKVIEIMKIEEVDQLKLPYALRYKDNPRILSWMDAKTECPNCHIIIEFVENFTMHPADNNISINIISCKCGCEFIAQTKEEILRYLKKNKKYREEYYPEIEI